MGGGWEQEESGCLVKSSSQTLKHKQSLVCVCVYTHAHMYIYVCMCVCVYTCNACTGVWREMAFCRFSSDQEAGIGLELNHLNQGNKYQARKSRFHRLGRIRKRAATVGRFGVNNFECLSRKWNSSGVWEVMGCVFS